MDCGPAALKSLLDSVGTPVSYGRLREACQTGLDGTSVTAIEEAAQQLGLDASQQIQPPEHVRFALPALVVVNLPNQAQHFVVAWKRVGPYWQVMDPAVGRRWVREADFRASMYRHTEAVPAEAWAGWIQTPEFLRPLRERVRRAGGPPHLVDGAVTRPDEMARLDAALREGRPDWATRPASEIAREHWTVRPVDGDPSQLLLRGALIISVAGQRPVDRASLPRELRAAVEERDPPPAQAWAQALRGHSAAIASLVVMLLALGAGAVLESYWLLNQWPQSGARLLAPLWGLALSLLLLDWLSESGLLRLGRRLEAHFRRALAAKLPRLEDRYFGSRLVSDMAQRAHALHLLRGLPALAGQLLRASAGLMATAAALVWMFPTSTALILVATLGTALAPLLAQPVLGERDLRAREHTGALSRFLLDALLGLVPLRAHGGAAALTHEHTRHVGFWRTAALRLQRSVVAWELLQTLWALGFAVAIVVRENSLPQPAPLLLLVFWTLQTPLFGQAIAAAAWQYPAIRNTALRMLEPLQAPEAPPSSAALPEGEPVALQFDAVDVVAAGQPVLRGISATIGAGEHVAIVGVSGAGKSSLAGLLLGWHTPAQGQVRVDGELLTPARIAALRPQMVWIDPQVQLWDRSLADNVRYGHPPGVPVDAALESSGLALRWSQGPHWRLGEGGALVAGGLGQCIRIARGLLPDRPRLVILDEATRGLSRDARQQLLRRLRQRWPQATLLAITHDIAGALPFPRVLVLHEGRLVEDGPPEVLAAAAGSRFHALLEAERQSRAAWSSRAWRHWRLAEGQLREERS